MRLFCILLFTLFIFGVQCKLIDSSSESFEHRFDSSSSIEDDDDIKCPKNTYLLDADNKCHPCSICGPDLYEREECTPESDTVCDWCLSTTPTKNNDFKLKCGDVDLISRIIVIKTQRDEPMQDDLYQIFAAEEARAEKEAKRWAVAANVAKFGFYFLLIILIVIVIRYVRKSKQAYRTITLTPPMLNEHDSKDIIRAADHIRTKLGKKGYDRLEEFV